MKQYLIAYFIFLPFVLFSQYNVNVDSLLSVIPSLEGNEQANAYISIAQHYGYSGKDSLGFDYIQKAYKSATDNETKGLVLFWHAFIHQSFNDDNNQLKKFDQAIAVINESNDSLKAEVLYWKARTYERKGMYPEALAAGFETLELTKQLPNKKKYIRALQEVGYIYDRMSEFEKAIEWHKKGLEAAMETKDKTLIGRCYGLIGIAYDELKDYDKALENNLIAVDYFKQANDSLNLATWYSNIGNTYTKKGDLANAERYLLKSLSIEENKKIAKINLGKVYARLGKFRESEEILQKTLVELLKNDDKQFASEAYYCLHELRKEQNNYKDALNYFQKYKEIQDEMLNEAKFEQINEMTVKFETAQKEQALAEEKLKVANHELSIKNKNNLLLIFGIAIITTMLLSVIFLSQQRFKNKQLLKEKELSTALSKIETNNKLQKQRLEISRDLHDNIGAQLTFIISSIENLKMLLSDKEGKMSQKLTTISQFTRSTIQELRDTIWAMNKESISLEDLHTRISNFIDNAKISLQNISFSFNYDPNKNNPKEFNSALGMNVYRIIQEAINNAIKHAEARTIAVNFSFDNDIASVDIVDDGKGINLDKNIAGNGLASMKKRAQEINGKLTIEKIKQGTKVSLQFPCKTT